MNFRGIFFSTTAKDSSILFLGTVTSNLLNFLALIILGNNFGNFELGLFLTALTFMQLLGDFFELGINSAVLNYVSGAKGYGKFFVATSFYLKILVGIIIGSLIIFFADAIASNIFKEPQILPLLKISGLVLPLLLLINWSQTVFQANRLFFVSALVNLSPNVFRMVALLVIIYIGSFGLINTYFWFNVVFGLSFVLALFYLKLEFVVFSGIHKVFLKLLIFGLPVGLSFALAALYTRIDQLVVFNLLGAEQAGIYGLAYRLNLFFVFAVASFNTAIAPRFVSLSDKDFTNYFKKVMFASLGIVLIMLIILGLSSFIWKYLFALDKQMAILPFQILGIGTIFFVLSSPFFSAILYRFKKNYFGLIISAASLFFLYGLLDYSVQPYGITGAAVSVGIIYFSQFIISGVYFRKLVKNG